MNKKYQWNVSVWLDYYDKKFFCTSRYQIFCAGAHCFDEKDQIEKWPVNNYETLHAKGL